MPIPMVMDIWETSWRVPSAIPFLLGAAILGWGLLSGFLAFTGSQRSGQPEIHFPRQEPAIADEPPDAEAGEPEA